MFLFDRPWLKFNISTCSLWELNFWILLNFAAAFWCFDFPHQISKFLINSLQWSSTLFTQSWKQWLAHPIKCLLQMLAHVKMSDLLRKILYSKQTTLFQEFLNATLSTTIENLKFCWEFICCLFSIGEKERITDWTPCNLYTDMLRK